MKIGLLQCDHVAQPLLPIGGNYPHMFSEWLPGYNWEVFDLVNGHFPNSIDDCDAYITTGSKYSVYEDQGWIHRFRELVQTLFQMNRPFIGICFGHQMIAEALGGKVGKAGIGWCIGIHTFRLVRREKWMQPPVEALNLLMSCRDQVLQLPENSIVLATSDDCPVAMYQVGDAFLGIQAHPEFPKTYAKALMEIRRLKIGDEKVREGLESLTSPVDASLMSGWMKGFLASRQILP